MWSAGTLRTPGEPDRPLAPSEVSFEVLERWRSPRTGAEYPVRLRVRAGGRVLELTALMPDQELDSRRSTGAVYRGRCGAGDRSRARDRARLSGDDRLSGDHQDVVRRAGRFQLRGGRSALRTSLRKRARACASSISLQSSSTSCRGVVLEASAASTTTVAKGPRCSARQRFRRSTKAPSASGVPWVAAPGVAASVNRRTPGSMSGSANFSNLIGWASHDWAKPAKSLVAPCSMCSGSRASLARAWRSADPM